MEVNKDTIWFYIIDKVIIVILLGIFAYRNNRKLEKFKNDLLKENRVFSDKYDKIHELKNIIYDCKISIDKAIIHSKNKKKYGFDKDIESTTIVQESHENQGKLDRFLQYNNLWLMEELQDTSKQVLNKLGEIIKQILAYDLDNVMVKREESRLKDIEIEFLDAIKVFDKEFLNFINNFQK